MMAARLLADRLIKAEADGRIHGCVSIIPFANPLGLGQFVHGDQHGRFDLHDGRNFNRDYPDVTAEVADRISARLTDDAAANVALIRDELRAALEKREPRVPSDILRHHLLRLAVAADVVLDLHCDGEAEVHLYTQKNSLERLLPLAALTGCRAVLLADVSGGNPFDEALARPWIELAQRFPDGPIPMACATGTVELRGRSDVSRSFGARDADALMAYLVHLGVLAGTVTIPDARCSPTPLAGSQALEAPVAGLLSYTVDLGAVVHEGETVAEITDLASGSVTAIKACTTGVFYARPATRIAEVGKRLGKIAGAVPFRHGPLLSP
jgi:predicted deacylase